MKKGFMLILAALMLLSLFAGCKKTAKEYPSRATNQELGVIESVLGRNVDLTVSPLYNENEEAAYMLGVSESGYVILKRANLLVRETGEVNPYENCMEMKKYYKDPGGYIVYDPANPDKPFHNLVSDTYAATVRKAAEK